MGRFIPSPFVLAIVLTLGTMAAVLMWGDLPADQSRFAGMLRAWSSGSGMWKLLAFAMQMSLILLGGHVLAETVPLKRALAAMARLPGSGGSAAVMVAATATALGLLNWGLALVGGALLARETGRALHERGIKVHYPVLAAAGYMGLLVWHGGFSGSAPLAMTSTAGAAKVLPEGLVERVGTISLDATIFSPLNLIVSGGLLVLLPTVFLCLARRAAMNASAIDCFIETTADRAAAEAFKPSRWWLGGVLGLLLLTAACVGIGDNGIGRLGLNQVIMVLLGLGLLLHHSPAHFSRAAGQAAAGCAGIIVQFPLYAGIMGLLITSGLCAAMTNSLVELASPDTLPLATLVSAGIVNMLVPSGGGQWAVQGPIALQAGLDAGVAPSTMLMSVAFGDELTNMLQPFWALPLLAITGVKARDVVGFTFVAMLVAFAWMALWLLVLG